MFWTLGCLWQSLHFIYLPLAAMRHIPGFCQSQKGRDNKIIICSVYQALYIISQPWQTRAICGTSAVQKDIIISAVIIITAIHSSSSVGLQHMGLGAGKHCSSSSGTVTARYVCTSCAQAQIKHSTSQQHCARFTSCHITDTEGTWVSRSAPVQCPNEELCCLTGWKERKNSV